MEHQQYYLLHADGMRKVESKILSIFSVLFMLDRKLRKVSRRIFSHIKKSQGLQSFILACEILITRD